MKKQLVSLVARSLLVLLLTCGLALANVEQPQLLKLKHAVLSPTSEQVVLQLNGSYSPKVFTLKDENPRVVFDFAGMTHSREVNAVTTTNGSIVKRIRVGMHSGESAKTRIVFDVATLKGITYTQHFDEKTSALVVRFTGLEKAAPSRVQPDRKEIAVSPTTTATAESTPPSLEAPAVLEQDNASIQKTEEQATKQPDASRTPAAPAPEPPPPAKTTVKKPTGQPAAPAPGDTPITKETPQPEPAPPTPAADMAKPTPAAQEKQEDKKVEAASTEPPPVPGEQKVPAKTEEPEKTAKGKTETAKTAESPQLEYVKFDASSPKGEMVLFKLNGFHPPAVHGVEEGTPRVICDFNNTKLVDTTKNLIKTDGKFVKAIRTSRTKKPERVRVVVELEPNRSYDLQQVFFKEDNLFVLIVNTVKK